jgi:hypothetical protein
MVSESSMKRATTNYEIQNQQPPQRFVRSPAGISRASLPQAQHRLSRLLLICRRAATSLRKRQS